MCIQGRLLYFFLITSLRNSMFTFEPTLDDSVLTLCKRYRNCISVFFFCCNSNLPIMIYLTAAATAQWKQIDAKIKATTTDSNIIWNIRYTFARLRLFSCNCVWIILCTFSCYAVETHALTSCRQEIYYCSPTKTICKLQSCANKKSETIFRFLNVSGKVREIWNIIAMDMQSTFKRHNMTVSFIQKFHCIADNI